MRPVTDAEPIVHLYADGQRWIIPMLYRGRSASRRSSRQCLSTPTSGRPSGMCPTMHQPGSSTTAWLPRTAPDVRRSGYRSATSYHSLRSSNTVTERADAKSESLEDLTAHCSASLPLAAGNACQIQLTAPAAFQRLRLPNVRWYQRRSERHSFARLHGPSEYGLLRTNPVGVRSTGS